MTTRYIPENAAKYPPVTGTSFWHKKMTAQFQRLDVNGDGFLTKEDFKEMGDKMVLLNGLTGHEAEKARDIYIDAWNNHHKPASGDKVTYDDFITRRLTEVNGPMRENLGEIAKAIFESLDVDSNDSISIKEFLTFAEACHMGKGTGLMIFQMMDKNDDGGISLDEFADALYDFLVNEDPSSPYKLLWGPLPQI